MRRSAFSSTYELTTSEQEARAMDLAASTITNIKELLKRNDLPLSAFEPVFRLYCQQLEGVLFDDRAKAIQAEHAERETKVTAIRAARANAMQFFPGGLKGVPGPASLSVSGEFAPGDGLDMMSNEEIDAIHKTLP